jgi:hypothetical protein
MENDYFAVKPGLCHRCGLTIDAACRYFRCGQSYHIRCLGDEVRACRECRNSHLKQAEAKRDAIVAAKEESDLQQRSRTRITRSKGCSGSCAARTSLEQSWARMTTCSV